MIYFFLVKNWRKGRKNFLTNVIVLKVTSVEQKRKMGQGQAQTLCTAGREKPWAKMPRFTSDGEAADSVQDATLHPLDDTHWMTPARPRTQRAGQPGAFKSL